jgi:hypothetical protein
MFHNRIACSGLLEVAGSARDCGWPDLVAVEGCPVRFHAEGTHALLGTCFLFLVNVRYEMFEG